MGCFSSRTSDHGPVRLQESKKEEGKKESSNEETVKAHKATENSVDHSQSKAVEKKFESALAKTVSNSQKADSNDTDSLISYWLSDIYSIAKLNYHSKV